MINNKENLLVTLSIGDLQQLMQDAVKIEMENFKNLVPNNHTDPEQESNLLTREQTAKLLKVSVTSLHNWAKKEILMPKKIGRRIYYFKSEVYEKINSYN